MFERFTDRARRVVVLAQEEARTLNHDYIGTEHILLGLIHEGEGVACKALESLGIELDGVRTEIEEIIGKGLRPPSGHIPFTPRAKKVLELSLREALQLGHNYIGTEHILLGLLREGEGVAAQIMIKMGAQLTRVRQRVIQLLSGYQGESTMSGSRHGSFDSDIESPAAASDVDEEMVRLTVEELNAQIAAQLAERVEPSQALNDDENTKLVLSSFNETALRIDESLHQLRRTIVRALQAAYEYDAPGPESNPQIIHIDREHAKQLITAALHTCPLGTSVEAIADHVVAFLTQT